jgi:hypothetical protein
MARTSSAPGLPDALDGLTLLASLDYLCGTVTVTALVD